MAMDGDPPIGWQAVDLDLGQGFDEAAAAPHHSPVIATSQDEHVDHRVPEADVGRR
ncbi:MAG TPA: hypothetical protein VH165_14260 [Kofleriaceae bacterium]|jgi:hypothetical protein|nr:hypothetical protein [Kofleriaceae bacterium]